MARLTGALAAAAACLAVTVAAVAALAGCTTAAGADADGTSSLTNGIGPITFAIGSDDISWLTPVLNAWNASSPQPAGHPAVPARAANDQLAQLVANLQAKSDTYDVIDLDVGADGGVRVGGWIIPLPAWQVPAGEFLRPAVTTAEYQGRLYAIPDYSNADLLYYRSDILAKAHKKPPTTWAQLQSLAAKVAPKYHLDGYAATLAPYEGLTVNFAEAVQSAGGSILSPDGTQVTVDSPSAVSGLEFLVNGLRQRWIPAADLGYEEVSAQQAFESGRFLFLNDWPDAYAAASQPVPATRWSASSAWSRCRALSAQGRARWAAPTSRSAPTRSTSRPPSTSSPTSPTSPTRRPCSRAAGPPVWKQIYSDPSLRKQFPYLPVLEQAIDSAQPRPVSADYDQASLVISSAVQAALRLRETPQQALSEMASQLTQIIQ